MFTLTETLQALSVEVIRRLWDAGQYRDNRWLRLCHDNWIAVWAGWRAQLSMRDVDLQAEQLVETWSQQDDERFLFTEEEQGDTPLGGPMRLKATPASTTTSSHEKRALLRGPAPTPPAIQSGGAMNAREVLDGADCLVEVRKIAEVLGVLGAVGHRMGVSLLVLIHLAPVVERMDVWLDAEVHR